MNFLNFLNKNIVLPLSDYITNWKIKDSLDFLLKSQWWEKNKLLEYQNERFIKLINHSYQTVPYYNELFKKIGIHPNQIKDLNDLKKIPILTKDDLNLYFKEKKLLSSKYNKSRLITKRSSGSTGKQTMYYINPEAYGFNLAANLRGWIWMGYNFGDNTRNTLIKKLQDLTNNVKLFTAKYDEKIFDSFLDLYDQFKPKFLRSYPDPLFFISKLAIKNNYTFNGLKAINTTGNILPKDYRELIEKVFNTKIFDSYSCEGCPVVFECSTHECYHIAMEYGIIEIINENGEEVEPGQIGRIVVTDLQNFAYPIIRYDTKDLAIKGHNCKCGRNHDTIIKIIGRDNDILITPYGEYLIAQNFTTYFKYIESIIQFQIIQPDTDKLIFKLVVSEDFSTEIEKKILNDWNNFTKNTMKIEIEKVDQIELLQSGKRRFLIRNQNIKLI